jgi:ABC-2 type transport system ATP-binding protein
MQQKIQFIAALMHDPDMIVMDEPFAGLDPVNTMQLKDVLVGLRAAGKSILFSTHRMDQVEKLCDSICLINHGKAVLQGSLSEVKNGNGRRFVQIDYEGDSKFLAGNPLIDSLNDYGNHAELRLKPGGRARTAADCDAPVARAPLPGDGPVARTDLHRTNFGQT